MISCLVVPPVGGWYSVIKIDHDYILLVHKL